MNITSQILNSGKRTSIEKVYSKVETEEQQISVMIDKVSGVQQNVDFCWDLHPKRKNVTNREESKIPDKRHGDKKVTAVIENSSHEGV